MWIVENCAHVRTTTLTVFQENKHDFSFNQLQTVCQHKVYSHTLLVSGLAGFQPLRLQGMIGKGCAGKIISSLAGQNASLCDLLHPPRDKPWALPLVPAGSQTPRLSSPTLLDGSPPWLFKHFKGLPAGYCRQAGEKVLPQIRHHSQKSRHIFFLYYENCFNLNKTSLPLFQNMYRIFKL